MRGRGSSWNGVLEGGKLVMMMMMMVMKMGYSGQIRGEIPTSSNWQRSYVQHILEGWSAV